METKGTRNLILMTGTPLTTPADVYGYTRLLNPAAYPTHRVFENEHITGYDAYNNAVSYTNENKLQTNFLFNGARVFRREIDPDLPEVSYEPMFYTLHPDHMRKYKELADQALLSLGADVKMDFATEAALQNALQQVIIGYDQYFETEAEQQKARAKIRAFELLDEVMSSMGERKLIVYAYYKRTIASLLAHGAKYQAVAVNGTQTASQRHAALDKFINDPKCRLLIGQPLSMGSGLDTLKNVCHEVLFLELPMVAKDFIQAVGRIDRNGQKNRCRVMLAIAEGTLQVRRQKRLLDKDEQANKIQNPSSTTAKQDLKAWIYGD